MLRESNAHEFDIFVPRLDLFDGGDLAALLGIPYGAGLLGVRTRNGWELHYAETDQDGGTWADRLHLATIMIREGKAPALTVPEVLVQRVGLYDPRDGTATLETSGRATRLVREWMGTKRRHITEELLTSAYPEHPRRRVVLFSLRSGNVPGSVRSYAQRNGLEGLFDVSAAPAPIPTAKKPLAAVPSEGVMLTANNLRELAAQLIQGEAPGSTVEVRADGHYRVDDGPWQQFHRKEPDAVVTPLPKRPSLHPIRAPKAYARAQ